MIENISYKDLKNMFSKSKKFLYESDSKDLMPKAIVYVLDTDKVGEYDPNELYYGNIWDRAETKEFTNLESALKYAKKLFNNDNRHDIDIDVNIPLFDIDKPYSMGIFGTVETRWPCKLHEFATIHAYDPDLVITNKHLVKKFERNYKYTYQKNYVSLY